MRIFCLRGPISRSFHFIQRYFHYSAKLDIIKALPLPKSVTNLCSFLGAVNFYHRFIPMASSLLSPLSALAVCPKTAIITWTDNTKSIFDKVKLALTQLVTLKFYDPNYELQLTTESVVTTNHWSIWLIYVIHLHDNCVTQHSFLNLVFLSLIM